LYEGGSPGVKASLSFSPKKQVLQMNTPEICGLPPMSPKDSKKK
jgi:hypothetical protein